MQDTLNMIGMFCAIGAAVCFVASVVMFFTFRVPDLWADRSGSFERRQIEEIRQRNSATSSQRRRMNVFEELEKKAKVKKPNTHSLNVGTSSGFPSRPAANPGTTALGRSAKAANPDFIIEKNIMFVSTSEVL